MDPRGFGKSIPPERDWPLEFLQRDAEDAIELVKVSLYITCDGVYLFMLLVFSVFLI